MMRRGMLPIIMLPDGDLRIALHLVPFSHWGNRGRVAKPTSDENLSYITPGTSSVNGAPPMPLRASSHPGSPNSPLVVLPFHGTVVGRDYLPAARTAALTRYCYATQPRYITKLYNSDSYNLKYSLYIKIGSSMSMSCWPPLSITWTAHSQCPWGASSLDWHLSSSTETHCVKHRDEGGTFHPGDVNLFDGYTSVVWNRILNKSLCFILDTWIEPLYFSKIVLNIQHYDL